MNTSLIKYINNVEVPRNLKRDFPIPELVGVDLSTIEVIASNGSRLQIEPAPNSDMFTVSFYGQQPSSIINLKIIGVKQTVEIEAVKEPEEKQEKPEKTGKKKKVRNPLSGMQKKQVERIDRRRNEIRRRDSLKMSDLQNKRVLTFDQTCSWPRALGMLTKAFQLQHQIGIPLYRYYDRITGLGDGAILAAAVAGMVSFDDLVDWWVGPWRKAHNRTALSALNVKLKSFLNPNVVGLFDAKKARKALKTLYRRGEAPLRMKDVAVGTELHVTVIQADLMVSRHESSRHPDLALWEVVEDTAITKMDYNKGRSVKGEAIFLSYVEKNEVMRMATAQNNSGLQITSIGAPVRVTPERDRQIEKLGARAMKVKNRDASHFVYEDVVEQSILKLKSLGLNIEYQRLECTPMDAIMLNSTTDEALHMGKESGTGKIDLPAWFTRTLNKQIA